MTPIPILSQLLHPEFDKGMVLTASLAQIYAIRTIFVVVPVVVVLVLTVINPVAVIVVAMVFFLTSVVLRSVSCIRSELVRGLTAFLPA